MLKRLILPPLFLLFSHNIFAQEILVTQTQHELRFIRDDQNNVVVDMKRKLMWQDDNHMSNLSYSWKKARDYCHYLDNNSYSDWYLPNIKELKSIISYENYSPAYIQVFKKGEARYYWSSTETSFDRKRAWFVSFKSGSTNYDHKAKVFSVRCVRSMRGEE